MVRPVPDMSGPVSEVAEPGEHLLATSWAMLRPPLAKAGYAMGWIGVYTMGRPAAHKAAEELSAASHVPLDGTMVVALTNRRLLVWSANMTFQRVDKFLGAVPRGRIRNVEAVTEGRSTYLRLDLADSEPVTLQTPYDAENMVTAFRAA